jgi:hypothetical protein
MGESACPSDSGPSCRSPCTAIYTVVPRGSEENQTRDCAVDLPSLECPEALADALRTASGFKQPQARVSIDLAARYFPRT